MSVLAMYREFRTQFPELSRAADIRHVRTWDSIEDYTAFCWFESLAGAVNDQMGVRGQGAEIALVFQYFEGKLQSHDVLVKTCIDTSFVENLFWDVGSEPVASIWSKMPQRLQRLYLDFHGRSPMFDET